MEENVFTAIGLMELFIKGLNIERREHQMDPNKSAFVPFIDEQVLNYKNSIHHEMLKEMYCGEAENYKFEYLGVLTGGRITHTFKQEAILDPV